MPSFRDCLRPSALTLLVLLVCGGLGCGGRHQAAGPAQPHGTLAQVVPFPAVQPELTQQRIVQARVELAAAACPAGVDAATFGSIREAFNAMLLARTSAKTSNKVPDEGKNTVTDAQVVDDGAGGFNLTWTFKNAGDYSSDGEVNLGDLTPVGINFGKTSASGTWATARAADGDGNGFVNINDLTPIGMNFLSQVSGYNIYGGASATGPWYTVDSVPIAQATAAFPRSFSYPLGTGTFAFYALAPYDAAGADWIDPAGDAPRPGGATASVGATTVTTTATIDGHGGTLTGGTGTPIEGVEVTFPEGALQVPAQVSLGYSAGTVTPVVDTWGGVILDLTTDYGAAFDQPVQITMPFTGAADDTPLPYYINAFGQLEECLLYSVDHAAGTFTFLTWHASSYTYIIGKLNNLSGDNSDTGFDPAIDSFQVSSGEPHPANDSADQLPCLGMVAFASWYWKNKPNDGSLFSRFMTTPPGQTAVGQRIIAREVFAQDKHGFDGSFFQNAVFENSNLTDAEKVESIRRVIKTIHRPVVVAFLFPQSNPTSRVAHFAMVYAYNGNNLLLYDPSLPKQTVTYSFNGTDLAPYGPQQYGEMLLFGSGSRPSAELDAIYKRAVNNFVSPATITIHFLEPGRETSDVNDLVQGHVTSGSEPVTDIGLVLNGMLLPTKLDLPAGGTFSMAVPMFFGDNVISFRTFNRQANGVLRSVPNNMEEAGQAVTIKEIGVKYPIRIVMTWDTPVRLLLYAERPGTTNWLTGSLSEPQDLVHGGPLSHYTSAENILAFGGPPAWGQEYQVKILKATAGSLFTQWKAYVFLNDKLTATHVGTVTEGDPAGVPDDAPGPAWSGYFGFTPIDPGP